MRDAEEYVSAFVKHHLDIGFERIVLLDNGSTDATVANALNAAGRSGRVTVLRCELPYGPWEAALKQYLARVLGRRGAWVLIADIDEHLHFPGMTSGRASLHRFVRYLDIHGYSVVLTQMVDLFPDAQPLDGSSTFDLAAHNRYDLSDVRFIPYEAMIAPARCRTVVPADTDLFFLLDGVRHRLFALERPLWLTKHSLLKPAAGPWLRHAHLTQKGRLADVTCALLHYPFTGRLRTKVERAVAGQRYGASANDEYAQYLQELTGRSELQLVGPRTRQLADGDQLLGDGIITAPQRYWLECASRDTL